MTVSRLTPKRAKSLSAKLTILFDKIKDFQDIQKSKFAADEKAISEMKAKYVEDGLSGVELDTAVQLYRLEISESTGIEAAKDLLLTVFDREYDFAMSIVADLFNCTLEEAEEIPFEDIFDFALKDRIIRFFFPRLRLLEAQMQLDTSETQGNSLSTPIPNTLSVNTGTKES